MAPNWISNILQGDQDLAVVFIVCATLVLLSIIQYKQSSDLVGTIFEDGIRPHANYIAKLASFAIVLITLPVVLRPASQLLKVAIGLGMLYTFNKTINYILVQDPR